MRLDWGAIHFYGKATIQPCGLSCTYALSAGEGLPPSAHIPRSGFPALLRQLGEHGADALDVDLVLLGIALG